MMLATLRPVSYAARLLTRASLLQAGLGLGLGLAAVAASASPPTFGNEVDARVGAMFDNMSLSEKINFTRVNDGRMLPALAAQGLPGTHALDSSMGVGVGGQLFGAQYPSQSALAATWSINRAKQYGLAIGYETRQGGGQQLLSPGLNMYRAPYGGRAAEYLSGEDPFIGAVLGPAVTNAIQTQGIQTSAKHYVANEVEANRHLLDVIVDQRALREIYLPGFESLVKNANPASVMCGFHKINGHYACESHELITSVLKGEWGFKGFVMSDFNSIRDAQKGAWAGTDLDMPSGLQFTEEKMYDLLYSNQVPFSVLDDKVRRNLKAMVSYGFDKGLPTPTAIDYYPGAAASLAMAREAIVLLKNSDGNRVAAPVLPLAANARIAVIGDLGLQVPASPFGTAWSPPSRYVTTKQGLELLNTDNSNITYIPALSLNPAASTWTQADGGAGMKAEYFANTTLAGSPAVTRVEPGVKLDFIRQNNVTDGGTTSLGGINTAPGAFSARFTGTIVPTVSGNHVFKVRADSPFKLYVNDKMVLEFDGKPLSGDVVNALSNFVKVGGLTAGVPATVRLEYRRTTGRFIPALGGIQGVQMSWAALQAPADLAHYDAVVISAGVNAEYEGEAYDRAFTLPEYQGEMIASVGKVNPKTVVIMHGGGPSEMASWIGNTGAVLQAWYSGQYAGQALAEIIYGRVNPSAKLPVTIGSREQDYPSYASYSNVKDYQPAGSYGAPKGTAKETMVYSDSVFMGYRGFDKSNVKPLFPFGFGMSYTSYSYGDLQLSAPSMGATGTVNATFTLTNTGSMAGFEVAQLYVSPAKPAVARPLKELKGFVKVYLNAGESKRVSIPIDARSLSYYAPAKASWIVDAGSYAIRVGPSSATLPLVKNLTAPALTLPTNTSNPLPQPIRESVQVSADQAY